MLSPHEIHHGHFRGMKTPHNPRAKEILVAYHDHPVISRAALARYFGICPSTLDNWRDAIKLPKQQSVVQMETWEPKQ